MAPVNLMIHTTPVQLVAVIHRQSEERNSGATRRINMATSTWLHVATDTRLTECLESVLKDQRPQCLPALLANYREHGVFPAQVSEVLMLRLVSDRLPDAGRPGQHAPSGRY